MAGSDRRLAQVEGTACAKEAESSHQGQLLLCGRDESMIGHPDEQSTSV